MLAPIINTLGTLIVLATPRFVEASRSSAAVVTASATNGKTRSKEAVLSRRRAEARSALVGYHHDGVLKILGENGRYGRWVVAQNAKTTGFPGVDALSKKWGCGTEGRKMRILA